MSRRRRMWAAVAAVVLGTAGLWVVGSGSARAEENRGFARGEYYPGSGHRDRPPYWDARYGRPPYWGYRPYYPPHRGQYRPHDPWSHRGPVRGGDRRR